MAKIALVEDEAHIASGLRFNLEMEGHAVTVIADGQTAHHRLVEASEPFDLIILDAMIPGMDGFAVCRALREAGNFTPVLFLTAKSGDQDKVQGLRLGADDDLTKPFNLDELLSRVVALLRRQRWAQPQTPETVRIGKAMMNLSAYEAQTPDGVVALTRIEASVVDYLIKHAGKAVSRDELMEAAWGFAPPLGSRTVDNFILRLRRLFEPDPANPVHLLSVRGVGYKLVL